MIRNAEREGGAASERPVAVLIAGPTASGKSALAIDLARALGGEIINTDSMQVYRELRVLTARPGADEEAAAPHRLYGTVPASQVYSAGRWLADAGTAAGAVRAAGRMPIFVGGTGLYFEALTRGLAAVPEVPAEVQGRLRGALADRGLVALREDLAMSDPRYAADAEMLDPQRVLRALGVIAATGRSLKDWQDGPPADPLVDGSRALRIVVSPDRDRLAERIAVRCRTMVAAGAVEEVRALRALKLDPAVPAMKAIGVGELEALIDGTSSEEEALIAMAAATRRYAKRQRTWMRGRMGNWHWFERPSAPDILALDPTGGRT